MIETGWAAHLVGSVCQKWSISITVLFDGIAYGVLFFLISVGLLVTLGQMNFVDLAHGAFALLGGEVCVVLFSIGLVCFFVARSATHYFFGVQQQKLCSHGEAVDDAARLLLQLGLLDVSHHPTCNLAYGRQRLIDIAVALAAQLRVLPLDESASRVPSSKSRELFETFAQLPGDATIFLIEHDVDLVFCFCRPYLRHGRRCCLRRGRACCHSALG